MSDRIRKQIYDNLNQKETDELVAIWQANNRAEWTDMAFDIIQQILQERLGELPAQDQPTLTATENTPNSEPDEEIVEQEDDAQPVFYKPDEVLRLEQWLHRTANAAVIMTVVYNLLQLPNTHEIVWSFFVNNDNALKLYFFCMADHSCDGCD